MASVFGIPILVAVVLGVLFPYAAISLVPYSIVFLLVLMINAGLVIDWQKTLRILPRWREIALGLFLLFVFFPLLLWTIADFLLVDEKYLYGFVFSSLCPVALVSPYFTKLHEADDQLSFLLMVSSMILCPLVAPAFLAVLFSSSVSINLVPIARYMLLLVTVPLIASIIISRYFPAVRQRILRYDHFINMISLSLLVFTLFGTASGKISVHYVDASQILILLALVFVQDFGVLAVARKILNLVSQRRTADALAISLSMKNVAIAAGVLLVYDPAASLAPALAFVAHACLFNFLAIPRLYNLLPK